MKPVTATSGDCLVLGAVRSQLFPGDGTRGPVDLALGLQRVAREQLPGDPPGPHQLEQAIRVVEDAVIGALAGLPAQPNLAVTSPDSDIATRIARTGRQPGHLVLPEIEALYQAMARAAERRAYTTETPFRDREAWAGVLILRELMHHHGYGAVHFPA